MKFDSVIIGGGLTGLLAGLRLQENGQQCAIVSVGQSALHFTSGSFDLLGTLPDCTPVDNPVHAMQQLPDTHPYRFLGTERCAALAAQVPAILSSYGIRVKGDSQKNHFRLTPMGELKRTWLSFEELQTFDSEDHLPFSRPTIVNFDGFIDFYPAFLVEALQKRGAEATVHLLQLPFIERLRKSPTEMRATNIAMSLENPTHRQMLIDALNATDVPALAKADVLLLPAILGRSNANSVEDLRRGVHKPLAFLATMPPSVSGLRMQEHLSREFVRRGGLLFSGDTVQRVERKDNVITAVYTEHHEDMPLEARHFLFACGSFFSRGLVALPDSVYEPIAHLDVIFTPGREHWYTEYMMDKQPYMEFGVRTDEHLHPSINGQRLENCYVAGAMLGGFNTLETACGGGVSILTALAAAEEILKHSTSLS